MKSIGAIFYKQLRDLIKNRMVLIQFMVFPLVALIFTLMVARPNDSIPDTMFITMFAGIFAGMTLLTTTAGIIAEDRERRSLRFLVMAGVKPYQYLLGIGGVMLAASIVISAIFALMGGFTGMDLIKFMAAMVLGSIASILLGATIGIISKNQQTATSLAMPIGMVLGFTPMLALFNQTVGTIFNIFYTMQVNVLVNDFSTGFAKPGLIIGANVAIFAILFVIAYARKGLRF